MPFSNVLLNPTETSNGGGIATSKTLGPIGFFEHLFSKNPRPIPRSAPLADRRLARSAYTFRPQATWVASKSTKINITDWWYRQTDRALLNSVINARKQVPHPPRQPWHKILDTTMFCYGCHSITVNFQGRGVRDMQINSATMSELKAAILTTFGTINPATAVDTTGDELLSLTYFSPGGGKAFLDGDSDLVLALNTFPSGLRVNVCEKRNDIIGKVRRTGKA